MKNCMRIVFIIIGTLIGAGFASGQEIYLFFYSYGLRGIYGIVISSFLMGVIIYKTLILVSQNKIDSYRKFLDLLVRNRKNNFNYYTNNMVNTTINIFILITFFIMIAGFGAYFEQEIRINSLFGSTFLAFLCLIIFKTSQNGIMKVSEIIVPILIAFIILIFILNIGELRINKIQYVFQNNHYYFLISSIIYSSYNSILLIPVLITINQLNISKKQILYTSILSGFIILLLSFVLFFLLTKIDVDINNLQMPLVYVISMMHKFFRVTYGIIILGSIFTTAISLGNSFLYNVSKNKKRYTQIAYIMCITSIGISKIGFSNLINELYPIFGIIGMIQIIMLLSIKKQNTQK